MNEQFNRKIAKAIKLSGKTIRTLEAETGISRTKLSNIGRGGRLYADEIPTICAALSIGLESMFEDEFPISAKFEISESEHTNKYTEALAEQLINSAMAKAWNIMGNQLSMDDVIRWFHSTNGRLAEHGQIADYISIFKEPESPESPLVAVSVGGKCLAKKSLRTNSPEEVSEYAASLPDEARFEVVNSYYKVKTEGKWSVTPRELVVDFRTVPVPFLLTYATGLFPVKASDNTNLLLNFSQVTSVRPILEGSNQEIDLDTLHNSLLLD